MATTETFRVKMKENNHEHMEKQNTAKEGSTGGKTTLTKAQVKCRPWKSQRWTKPKTYVLTFSNSNQQLPDEEKDPGGTSHFFHARRSNTSITQLQQSREDHFIRSSIVLPNLQVIPMAWDILETKFFSQANPDKARERTIK